MKEAAFDLPRCFYCGEFLVSIDDSFLCIVDYEIGPPYLAEPKTRTNERGEEEQRGQCAYPGNGDWHVERGKWSACGQDARFSHTECGPEIGYNIALWQIGPAQQDTHTWNKHLSTKTKFPSVWPELKRAGAVSEFLTERKRIGKDPHKYKTEHIVAALDGYESQILSLVMASTEAASNGDTVRRIGLLRRVSEIVIAFQQSGLGAALRHR